MTTRNSNNAKAIDMGEVMSRLDGLGEERRQGAGRDGQAARAHCGHPGV